MARTTLVLGMVCAALLLVAVDARGEELYDYETCFAFDPVFVQADQRQAPSSAPAREAPAAGIPGANGAKAADTPRLSLKVLGKVLALLSGPAEKPAQDTLQR